MIKFKYITTFCLCFVMLLLGTGWAQADRKIVINGKKCTFKSEDHISLEFGSTKVTHLEKVDDQCVFRLTAEVDGQFTESVCRVPVSRKPIIIEEPTSDRSKSLTDFYNASFDLRNCRTLKTGTLEEERHKFEQRKAIGVCESLEGGTVCPDGYMDWYCTNRDLCYREMIKKFPDIRMCTQLENKVFLRECIKPIAIKEQKYEQCLLISSEENRPYRNECLEIISGYQT